MKEAVISWHCNGTCTSPTCQSVLVHMDRFVLRIAVTNPAPMDVIVRQRTIAAPAIDVPMMAIGKDDVEVIPVAVRPPVGAPFLIVVMFPDEEKITWLEIVVRNLFTLSCTLKTLVQDLIVRPRGNGFLAEFAFGRPRIFVNVLHFPAQREVVELLRARKY